MCPNEPQFKNICQKPKEIYIQMGLLIKNCTEAPLTKTLELNLERKGQKLDTALTKI